MDIVTDLSIPLEIKPGVVRCARVSVSGKAVIMLYIDKKPHYVPGNMVGKKFEPLEKYSHIVDKYVPKNKMFRKGKKEYNVNVENLRESQRKHSIKQAVKYHQLRKNNNFEVVFNDETRKITPMSETKYLMSYKGFKYQGKIEDGHFVIMSAADKRMNKSKPKFTIKIGVKIPLKQDKKELDAA